VSFPELCTLSSGGWADEGTLCMALLQLQRDKQVTVSLHEGEKVNTFSFKRRTVFKLSFMTKPDKRYTVIAGPMF